MNIHKEERLFDGVNSVQSRAIALLWGSPQREERSCRGHVCRCNKGCRFVAGC